MNTSVEQSSTTSDPVLSVLEDAARRVQAGWCRGQFENVHGEVCTIGALQRATYRTDLTAARQDEVMDCAVRYLGFQQQDEAILWNDKFWRRKGQVVRRFRRAAARRRAHVLLNGGNGVATR